MLAEAEIAAALMAAVPIAARVLGRVAVRIEAAAVEDLAGTSWFDAVWADYLEDRISLTSALLRVEQLFRARLDEIDDWDAIDWTTTALGPTRGFYEWDGDRLVETGVPSRANLWSGGLALDEKTRIETPEDAALQSLTQALEAQNQRIAAIANERAYLGQPVLLPPRIQRLGHPRRSRARRDDREDLRRALHPASPVRDRRAARGRTVIERACPVCGVSMEDRRPQAKTCSPRCRRKRARWVRILSGRGDGPYRTIDQYEARLANRAQQLKRARAARLAGSPPSDFSRSRAARG